MNATAELAENVAVPFERALAMPRSVYTSQDFLERELDCLFRREWLCAGRASALPEAGDYMTMDIAGEPVMVIRGRDGVLRAQSNVCRHRMSVLLEGRGTVRSIVCPYHAWTYDLDGRLRGAPAMERNEGFDRGAIRLPQIRCEIWDGWIMVTLNPEAPPCAEALAGVDALVGHYGMEHYVESFRETHRWNTNWKVLAENFMESYHLPVCHAGTIGHTVDLNLMTCPEGDPAFNHHWILKDETMALTLAHPANTRLKGDDRRKTYLISIYPALLITLTPGYFWYLSLHPDGPDHVKNSLRRRTGAGIPRRSGRCGAFRRPEDAARCGERGGSRLHRECLSRHPRRPLGPRPALASRTPELRFRPLDQRPDYGLLSRGRGVAFAGQGHGRPYARTAASDCTLAFAPETGASSGPISTVAWSKANFCRSRDFTAIRVASGSVPGAIRTSSVIIGRS